MKITKQKRNFIIGQIVISVGSAAGLYGSWYLQGVHNLKGIQIGPRQSDIYIAALSALVTFGWITFMTNRVEKRTVRENPPLLYHGLASVVFSAVAILFWVARTNFGWRYLAWTALVAWGSYGIHWATAKNNIKGIDKHDAFM